MFQSFITFATFLATGAHALFGCCWHHDHARHHAGREMVQAVPESEVAVNLARCCQYACKTTSHKAVDQNRQPLTDAPSDAFPCSHPDEQDSAPCDEGHCQYVVNAKVELPSLQGGIAPFEFLPDDFGAKLPSGGQTETGVHNLSASLLSGSLCVRDLTQIALI